MFRGQFFVNPTNNKVIEVKDQKDEEGQAIVVNTRKGKILPNTASKEEFNKNRAESVH
jgi:hypothetical protein